MTETNAGLSELPQEGCLELDKRLNVAKSLLPVMREEATKFATQNSEVSRLEKSKIRWIPIVLMALSYWGKDDSGLLNWVFWVSVLWTVISFYITPYYAARGLDEATKSLVDLKQKWVAAGLPEALFEKFTSLIDRGVNSDRSQSNEDFNVYDAEDDWWTMVQGVVADDVRHLFGLSRINYAGGDGIYWPRNPVTANKHMLKK